MIVRRYFFLSLSGFTRVNALGFCYYASWVDTRFEFDVIWNVEGDGVGLTSFGYVVDCWV